MRLFLCFFSWVGAPGWAGGGRQVSLGWGVGVCVVCALRPLLEPPLLPSSSARSFICERKDPWVLCPSLIQECPEIWGVGAGSTSPPSLAEVTRGWQEPLEAPSQQCVCLCASPCCSAWIRRPFPPSGFTPLMPDPPKCLRPGDRLVLGGLQEPQSPCPNLAALPGWMLGQRCWQRPRRDVFLCHVPPVPAEPRVLGSGRWVGFGHGDMLWDCLVPRVPA